MLHSGDGVFRSMCKIRFSLHKRCLKNGCIYIEINYTHRVTFYELCDFWRQLIPLDFIEECSSEEANARNTYIYHFALWSLCLQHNKLWKSSGEWILLKGTGYHRIYLNLNFCHSAFNTWDRGSQWQPLPAGDEGRSWKDPRPLFNHRDSGQRAAYGWGVEGGFPECIHGAGRTGRACTGWESVLVKIDDIWQCSNNVQQEKMWILLTCCWSQQ